MTMTTPPAPTTAELLEHYLPAQKGRTPADRLFAIAGKALKDGAPRIEQRIQTKLLPDERYDAHSHLTLIGLKCVQAYNPDLDRGTGTVPIDIRFGRFAYLRMRLALIDWERKHLGDQRPGRTRHPSFVPLTGRASGEEIDPDYDTADGLDVHDHIASRDQAERWKAQAASEGLTLTTWVAKTLDAACSDRRAA